MVVKSKIQDVFASTPKNRQLSNIRYISFRPLREKDEKKFDKTVFIKKIVKITLFSQRIKRAHDARQGLFHL